MNKASQNVDLHAEAPESIEDEEIREKSVGSRPIDDITHVHDASGDDETDDGLNESDESTRHAAEDIPTGVDPLGPLDSVPVFDRASLPPKV